MGHSHTRCVYFLRSTFLRRLTTNNIYILPLLLLLRCSPFVAVVVYCANFVEGICILRFHERFELFSPFGVVATNSLSSSVCDGRLCVSGTLSGGHCYCFFI